MAKKIVIIGAGPGGYVAGLRAAAMGADVTIVEKEQAGGTCLHWGCIPSKIMKSTGDLLLKTNNQAESAIRFNGEIKPDMTALVKKKQRIINIQQQGIIGLLKKSAITIETGTGYIKDQGVGLVTSPGGNQKEHFYDSLILATGTRPLELPQFSFDHKSILSSNDLLSLEQLPKSMVILGGGVIGCEFAFILNAFGCVVTVVEAMERLIPLDCIDLSVSKVLQREMKKRKIRFFTSRSVTKARKQASSLLVTIGASPIQSQKETPDIDPKTLEVETLAVCIGRASLAKGLGLGNIGVETNEKGWIPVNNRMETRVKDVYAVGDCLGPSNIMLAHVASHEGMVAAENAMGGQKIMHYHAVPNAVFTMPEIGCVGITEQEALAQGLEITATSVNFRTLGKAQIMGEIAGEAKIVAEKTSGRILGVHLIGPHATDLIAQGALAVNRGLTLEDFSETIHAHPTLAEIYSEVSLKALGMPLHG